MDYSYDRTAADDKQIQKLIKTFETDLARTLSKAYPSMDSKITKLVARKMAKAASDEFKSSGRTLLKSVSIEGL